MNYAPQKAEYYVPSLFFEKAGDNKKFPQDPYLLQG